MGKTAVKERSPEALPEARPAPSTDGNVATCRHHWLIETPRGALSGGRCKLCGETREFRNSANDYIWDDDSSNRYNKWSVVSSARKAGGDDEMTTSSGGGRVAMAV